jgi:hypothetical protein
MSELEEQLHGASDEEPSLRKIDKKLSIALIYLTQHEKRICDVESEVKTTKDNVFKWAWGILSSVIIGIVTLFIKNKVA